MKQPLPRNEKEAPRVSLQEPQDYSIEQAAQPEQPVKGDGSSDAAELQRKMKAAAKEFCDLLTNRWILSWDHIPRDSYLFKELSPYVQCTPKGVFYSFEGQWIRMTREYMRDPGAVEYLRKAFKKFGKASWTLPRIKKGGAE